MVELRAGALTAARRRRHARAVLAAGADQVARASAAPRRSRGSSGRRSRSAPTACARCAPTRERHYGLDRARLLAPKVIVEHFTATSTLRPGVEHLRRQRARRGVRRAARRVRALHRRPRRDDPPARAAEVDVPPHRRAQPRRVRDRARRGLRRRRDGPPPPAHRLAGAHALAAGPLRDPRPRRDRPRREPLEPVPPRARGGDAQRARTGTSRRPRCAATGGCCDRPRPPRPDRVERRRPPHGHHRPAADRGRPRRRPRACGHGWPATTSRSCSRARSPAPARPPSSPGSATAPSSIATCASTTTATTRDSPPTRSASAGPGWYLWDDGAPDGETPEQVGERADRAIARALEADGDVALFAHGHILRVLGARWIELPAAGAGRLALGTAAVCELGHERDRQVIRLWNDTAHLA